MQKILEFQAMISRNILSQNMHMIYQTKLFSQSTRI